MIAILDIGSNSVRLMLWANGKSLYKKVATTRLAEGAAQSGVLTEPAMARTVAAIGEFCGEARAAGARIYAFATAAVRSAQNGTEFCKRTEADCGVLPEIISGEEEAQLGLTGALGSGDGGVIDIGGASTEVCYREAGKITFSASLPVGCVKLFDVCKDDRTRLSQRIAEALSPLNGIAPVGVTYCIGGTAATLARIRLGLPRYDAAVLQETPLKAAWLQEEADKLLALSAKDRKKIAGMDPVRADVIAGGTLLLSEIMKKIGIGEAFFSDRDNLEGFLTARGIA